MERRLSSSTERLTSKLRVPNRYCATARLPCTHASVKPSRPRCTAVRRLVTIHTQSRCGCSPSQLGSDCTHRGCGCGVCAVLHQQLYYRQARIAAGFNEHRLAPLHGQTDSSRSSSTTIMSHPLDVIAFMQTRPTLSTPVSGTATAPRSQATMSFRSQ